MWKGFKRNDFKFIGSGGGRSQKSFMIQKWNPKLNESVTRVPIHVFYIFYLLNEISFLFRYAKIYVSQLKMTAVVMETFWI